MTSSNAADEARPHEPVLLNEVLALLKPKPGQVVVDGTLGGGGHSRALLERVGAEGRLIGIDQDPEALERAKANLKEFPNVEFIHSHFSGLDEVLRALNLPSADAVILDVGVSTEQLEKPERGFSFLKEGPLDMRMDLSNPVTARDLIRDLSQEKLESLFRTLGEERWSKRIAAAICRRRVREPIVTTGDLVKIIQEAVPKPARFGPRHPAMRVFQALRIEVNQELRELEAVLPKALKVLKTGGRLAVISFHSLEDRRVKQAFRQWSKEGRAKLLTPKPVGPGEEEIRRNPRSRSAKLRVIEKMETEGK